MTLSGGIRARFRSESGTGAGTVILCVGAFCITTWIFFAVVDWIVAVKGDRQAMRDYQTQQQIQRPFVVQERPSTQVTY